jgi:hypothetical protein
MTERAYKSYKLKFKFSFEQPLSLPKYYNSVLQGFFYKNMDPILASILHKVGFVYSLGRIRKKRKQHFVPSSRCSCLFFHFLSQEVEALKIKKLIREMARNH